jgi:hypothetical protein
MNKSWRMTAILAGLFVILTAVYFLSNPPATTSMEKLESPRVLDVVADQVSKIEIDQKGAATEFERSRDTVGEYWRINGPKAYAADGTLVQQMLFALDQLVKAGAIDPGKPESAPQITGLAEPRLVVTYTSSGRRDVLRFGKSSPTDSTTVFYQHDGDPKIYKAKVEVFESFNKSKVQYRSRTLVRFQPHRVTRVELSYKFMRGAKGGALTPEYEDSTFERFEEGLERGWYLTKPHKERMDDHAVQKLITELANLQAAEYQTDRTPEEQGLVQPEARVVVYFPDDKPIEVKFGAERNKNRWVALPGTGETALVEGFRYAEIPLQRNHFRVRTMFPFSGELVRKMEIEVKDLGKVVLDRVESKKEGEAVATVKWQVTEPADLKVESERVEAFVGAVVVQQITGFLGKQDFKLAGLDPAPIQLVVTTKEGKRHVLGFSSGSQGYMRREAVDEIFEVKPDFVRMLQRLELNFINMEMFNIPRADLREFSFDGKATDQLQPVYYTMKLDEKTNAWSFTDPGHKGAEVDPDRMNAIVAILNYIRAEALLARDDKTIAENRLAPGVAPATLKIVHAKGAVELYISDDLSNLPNRPKHLARFSDSKTVFQINGTAVTTLKQVPVLKKDAPKDEPKEK